jgi:hypothetical protein
MVWFNIPTGKALTIFEGPQPDEYSFVYMITNLKTGKKYIGKKLFWFKKKLIRKARNKRILVESDWREYYGSSKEVLADIEKYGKENFHRQILHLCKNKGEASYIEAKEQFDRAVLFHPEEYYNSWIICRVSRKHVL